MITEAVESNGASETSELSPSEVTKRRGEIFGTFVYRIESSGFPMSSTKTDELLGMVGEYALKPSWLRLGTERYNDLFMDSARDTVKKLREEESVEDIENRQKFYERISVFSPYDQLRIRIAYDLAKYSHRGTFREGGERYFEHVRKTALILLDEVKLYDNPDLIIAALLHDAVEDATIFGSQKNITTKEWIEEAGLRLSHIFGPYVSEMVTSVTKPKKDGVKIKSKDDVHKAYLDQLRNASPEALLVKMADRLHNLRTLHFRPKEDQLKVARETLDEYIPIFNRDGFKYSAGGYASWMISQMTYIARAYLDDQVKYLPIEWGGKVDYSPDPDDPIQYKIPLA